jgi:hypothetical protein
VPAANTYGGYTIQYDYDNESSRQAFSSNTFNWAEELQRVTVATDAMRDSFLHINATLGEINARSTDAREYAPRNQRVALRRKFGNLAYKFYFTESVF